MTTQNDSSKQEASSLHSLVRPLTVATKWEREGEEWRLVLASDAPHDKATLAKVTENTKAVPTNRWHWTAMGSTWWAADRETAMRHAELRLSFDSHGRWCDYAEAVGIHPHGPNGPDKQVGGSHE